MSVKVTITATMEPEKNTVNFYGAHNLCRDLIRMLTQYDINYMTLHVTTKDEALRAAEFCAKNNIEYRIGGAR